MRRTKAGRTTSSRKNDPLGRTQRIMEQPFYQDPTRPRYVEDRYPTMCRLCTYVPRTPRLGLTPEGVCIATRSCERRQREDPLTEAEKRMLWGDR